MQESQCSRVNCYLLCLQSSGGAFAHGHRHVESQTSAFIPLFMYIYQQCILQRMSIQRIYTHTFHDKVGLERKVFPLPVIGTRCTSEVYVHDEVHI